MNDDDLRHILEEHAKWLREAGGKRADLSWTVLRGADLRGADLREAYMRGAIFSGANLIMAKSIKWAEVGWSDHGECGRKLLAVQINNEARYFCGCWQGTINELRQYIASGDQEHRHTRTIAADFCEARMQEMMKESICGNEVQP